MSDSTPSFEDGIDRYGGPADNGVSADAQEELYCYISDHAPVKPWTAIAECSLSSDTGRQALRAITLDGYVTPNADGNMVLYDE